MSPNKQTTIKDNYIFGLDIGTRSIVGIVGYKSADTFNVVADCVLEHDTRAMIDGQIYDIEKVTESVKEVKLNLEKQLGFSLKKVCIAAAGRVLITNTVHVEQTIDSASPIDDDRIFALELLGIEKAHQEINSNIKRDDSSFHCVGYTVTKYYLNNYEISNLHGHKGKKIAADVLSTFLPKEVVESLHQVVSKAGLEVYDLTLEPIAAINVAIPNEYRLLNIALVDIGAGTSDIAITKDGSIIAYGMIPMAGDEITESIVQEYLVDFKTAEHIKIKAASKAKKIAYKDIMGLQNTVTIEEVNKKIHQITERLAERIAEKIIELNGNRPTNAVFIVGGGGQVTAFTDLLAQKLQLPQERVALRGKTVLNQVKFTSNRKKTPELVTPIGICLNGLENNKKEFMQVYLNDEPINIFDNGNLTVMDIVAFKGVNPQELIAKRGNDLTFYVNGIPKTIRGQIGEPAKILVNNQLSSLNGPIAMNDYIVIVPTAKGKDAEISTNQLFQQIEPLHIQINGTKYTYKPRLMLNGKNVNINYDIRQDDRIETAPLMVKELFVDLNIKYNSSPIFINNKRADLDSIVHDKDYLVFDVKDEIDSSQTLNSSDDTSNKTAIEVIVNGEFVKLDNKRDYVLVDVFDKISFDLTRPNGVVVCEINGEKMPYMSPIKNGDQLSIYWSNIN